MKVQINADGPFIWRKKGQIKLDKGVTAVVVTPKPKLGEDRNNVPEDIPALEYLENFTENQGNVYLDDTNATVFERAVVRSRYLGFNAPIGPGVIYRNNSQNWR